MARPLSLITWSLGLILVFVGERFFGEGSGLRWPATGLGVLFAVVALANRARSLGGSAQQRTVMARLVLFYGAGLLGLALYFAATMGGIESESMDIALRTAWPIALLCGTLPALAMERSLLSMAGSDQLEVRRLFEAGNAGLAIGLATAWLFALNWVASETDERIDLRTVRNLVPSGQTLEMARNLDEEVTVTLFFPPANDVLELIEPYFDDLDAAGANLVVQRKDRDMHPGLAKELRARKNGVVVFTKGEEHEQVRLDVDPKKARSKLKKLDKNVQTKLNKVSRDPRVAYLVTGHGERSTSPKEDDPPGLKGAKEVLKQLNYKVKNLGLKEGLSEDVPDDATLVIVAGPRNPMLPQELESLVRYLEGGGSMMLMVDPDVEEDPELDPLLELLGVTVSNTTLAHASKYVALTRRKGDRSILYSNRVTSHDSTTLLTKLTTKGNVVFPVTGALDKREGAKAKKDGGADVTFTMRTLAGTFADANDNREMDGTEEKKVYNLTAAVELADTEGTGEGGRAIVTADADVISDLLFSRVPMNQNWFGEATLWLEGEVLLAGEVSDIEDTPMLHTKDSDKLWFYGTTAFVPLLLIGFGAGVNRRRRRTA
ncbi:MAG: Gldg family protein [Deltaproteobacteria bacterium]|nr:Gldg family protein [Deltaproteobacteria bacterium]